MSHHFIDNHLALALLSQLNFGIDAEVEQRYINPGDMSLGADFLVGQEPDPPKFFGGQASGLPNFLVGQGFIPCRQNFFGAV